MPTLLGSADASGGSGGGAGSGSGAFLAASYSYSSTTPNALQQELYHNALSAAMGGGWPTTARGTAGSGSGGAGEGIVAGTPGVQQQHQQKQQQVVQSPALAVNNPLWPLGADGSGSVGGLGGGAGGGGGSNSGPPGVPTLAVAPRETSVIFGQQVSKHTRKHNLGTGKCSVHTSAMVDWPFTLLSLIRLFCMLVSCVSCLVTAARHCTTMIVFVGIVGCSTESGKCCGTIIMVGGPSK